MANTQMRKTQQLTETAIMIALATLLSYITIYSLPMGGSITMFAQVPIVILGYRYGFKWGAGAGLVYGILQMLLQGLGNFAYVKGAAAYIVLILADYAVAFAVLGIGGAMFRKIVRNQTVSIALGAAAASLMRFICHFISGVTIWGEYADGWKSVWAYSFAYNGSYMLVEGAITVVGVAALSVVLDFNSPALLRKRKSKA